jgi:GNAT superfamily N-acetyltransferase
MPRFAVRSYLEMREPSAFRPAAPLDPPPRIERVVDCPPAFWRFLYTEVGRSYHWVDRLPWTDGDIRAYLGDPAVSLYLMTVSGAPAGYFELRRGEDGAIEIVYFGLLAEFTGRGYGRHMLSEAVRLAWSQGASRVWLHTNDLDHPAALPNYVRRGFSVFREERYEVPE